MKLNNWIDKYQGILVIPIDLADEFLILGLLDNIRSKKVRNFRTRSRICMPNLILSSLIVVI